MWITKFPDDSWLRIPGTISRGSDSTRLLNYDVCIRINAADIRKRHDKIRQNVALSLVFGMFFARATAVPCFARYFILATAVNLVQDQIWSWSSRTFHIEFDRVNQSVWSVRYFNFSIFKSFRNKGWTAFFRIFQRCDLHPIDVPKNRLSITYISQILAKLFLRKQYLWNLENAIKRFLSYVYLSSIKIDITDQWIERRSHTCNSKNFPFVQSTMLRYTITRNKETEDGKNRSVV